MVASVYMVAGQGAYMSLTNSALSPRPRLAGLEWASPQENLWAWYTASRLGSKCLCYPASRCLCVYTRVWVRKLVPSSSLVFEEVCQHTPQPVCTCLFSIWPRCCINCHLFLLIQAAVFLRVTQLSLTPGCQLTFKAPDSNPTGFMKSWIQPLWLLKPNIMGISLPHVSS